MKTSACPSSPVQAATRWCLLAVGLLLVLQKRTKLTCMTFPPVFSALFKGADACPSSGFSRQRTADFQNTDLSRRPFAQSVTPTAVIEGPASIDRCSSLKLSASGSTGDDGSTGSSIVNYQWSCSRCPSSIKVFLREVEGSRTIILDRELIFSSFPSVYSSATVQQHEFELTITTAKGVTAQASKTVQVLPGISPAPTLSIVGNRQVQSRRDEVTSLAVSVAACPYARLGKEIKITWTMRGTGDSRPLDSLVDPFRNSLYMAIDPRKLVAGASYAVKATAAYAVQPVGASESSSVTFQVTTEKASLKLQFCVEPLRTGGTT